MEADGNGVYSMTLPGGVYTLTAGPVLPGYPDATVITDVQVIVSGNQVVDIPLTPQPALVGDSWLVDDNVAGGNNNGFAEPGESGLLLWETVLNSGAITATNVTAHLIALTPGVSVDVADASYPDIAAADVQENLTAFVFSVAPTVTCGANLDFWTVLTADQGVFTASLTIPSGVPGTRTAFFSDDMESGVGDWATGGTSTWGQTTTRWHSPSHSWTDSPAGQYQDNATTWLRSPIFDLSDAQGFELSFWHQYSMEEGYDFIYVEYSLDGGVTWEPELASYTGLLSTWTQETFAIPSFDNQNNVAFRFLLVSDGGVRDDGWYIDDVDLSYIPYGCTYPIDVPGVPVLIEPLSGTITTTQQITLAWEASAGWPPDGYNLELDGVVYTQTGTITDTWFDLGMHTWRVRAFNVQGYSAYTDAWMFEVVAAPGAPLLIAPPDVSLANNPVVFEWSDSGTGGEPTGYIFALDGASVVTFTTPVTSTAMTLTIGTHTWNVTAFNDTGVSPASDTWTVTVPPVPPSEPGVPILVSPVDAFDADGNVITFEWADSGTGAEPTGYLFMLDGTVVLTFTTPVTSTTLTLSPGVHTWSVAAVSDGGTSAYAEEWSVIVPYMQFLPFASKN